MKRTPNVNKAVIDQDVLRLVSRPSEMSCLLSKGEFEGDAPLEGRVSEPLSSETVDGSACGDEACAGSGYRAARGAHIARPGAGHRAAMEDVPADPATAAVLANDPEGSSLLGAVIP
jgi:hypothetical protein